MNNFLSNLLLIKNPNMILVANYLTDTCKELLAVFFLLGLILEYFTEFRFKDVLFRTFIAAIVLNSVPKFIETGVETSFTVSTSVLKRFSPNNPLVNGIIKSSKTKNSARSLDLFSWDSFKNLAASMVEDSFSFLTWVLTYLCFIFLKQIYSLVYYLLFAFLGISSLLSIIGLLKDSLLGSLKTLIWLYLTPLVVTICLIILGESTHHAASLKGPMASTLEDLIHLLVSAIILLFSPVLSGSILKGSGLYAAAETLSSTATLSNLMGLKSVLTNWGKMASMKGINLGSKASLKGLSLSSAPLRDSLATNFANKAQKIRDKKKLHPTVGQYLKEHNLDDPKLDRSPTEALKEDLKSKSSRYGMLLKKTSLSEKATLLGDNIFNFNKNKKARIERKIDSLGYDPQSKDLNNPLPLSNYYLVPQEKRIQRLHSTYNQIKKKAPKKYNLMAYNPYKVSQARLLISQANKGNKPNYLNKDIQTLANKIGHSKKKFNTNHRLNRMGRNNLMED